MNILNKEKILEQARELVDEGKLDRAIKEYEKILLADPQDLRVKLRVAELYTKRKQVNEAIKLYREVAASYADEGFFLKAVTVNKNILRLNPSLIDVNEQLAILYEKMGLIYDAIRQYGILAATLDSKGLTEKSVDIRSKIVALNPSDTQAKIRLAELYQREGKIDDAMVQYEDLARQLEKQGDETSRIADLYEKILSHEPDRYDMLVKLVKLYDKLGDKKKMLKWLDAGGDYVQESVELLRMHAEICESQNQHESARTKYMKLAEMNKASGNDEGALDAYYRILVMLPDEEDRLLDAVEVIRAGAMKEVSERARIRREELAAEELAKGERAQAEKHAAENNGGQGLGVKLAVQKQKSAMPVAPTTAEQPLVGKEKEEPPLAPTSPAPVAAAEDVAEKKAKEDVSKVLDTGPSVVIDPTKEPDAATLKKIEASYNLGMAYKKMGLHDVAKQEFEKARLLHDSAAVKFPESVYLARSLAKINLELGIEQSVAAEPVRIEVKTSAKPSTDQRTAPRSPINRSEVTNFSIPIKNVKGSEKGGTKKTGEPKPKRKTSFV